MLFVDITEPPSIVNIVLRQVTQYPLSISYLSYNIRGNVESAVPKLFHEIFHVPLLYWCNAGRFLVNTCS